MRTYNIFISHSWTYGEHYDGIVRLLDNHNYFNFRDYSVPINDPVHTNVTDKDLYNKIRDKMQGCHVVLILTGVYSTHSKWINKEIEIAKEGYNIGSKPIIGVNPWGSKNISSIVENNADKIVGWNSNSIVDAIRQYSL